MKIAIGADHRGQDAARSLARAMEAMGHEVVLRDECDPAAGAKACDYPDRAYQVANAVANGQADKGVLLCGSGIGMCIAANKVPGVRAALVHDEFTAQMAKSHNDANVLCLSADMLGQRLIERMVEAWMTAEFEGGRHARRVAKIQAIERGQDPSSISSESVTA
ncbi:MAG: ribose 5-phosphate isomerase B [Phycisphaeraceae bacterium]|nr:ribose 5-phosphate isomerase B [Phycisphaeraceae bacterium]